MMRIITGSARGRRLKTLDGMDVRPTAEKVKEAVFSAIQFDIEGRRILDAFAGSGQLGLEALSRGAKSAVFLDSSEKAIAVVKENIAACGFEKQAKLLHTDAVMYLMSCRETFDIAFVDPPYATEFYSEILNAVASVMARGGTIICESRPDKPIPEKIGTEVVFSPVKEYSYGKVRVTMYRAAG